MAPIRSTRSKHHDVNGVRDSGKGFSPYRLATVASGSKLLITPERNPRDRHLRRDPRPKRLQLKDLECIRRLGVGGNGAVDLIRVSRTSDTRDDPSLAQFAMKSVDKAYWRSVEREKDALNPKELKNIERRALVSLPWNPFIAGVLDAFSDKRNLYLMFELSPCVSLHHHIRAHGPVSDDAAKFYLANIMLGVEFLHSHGLVHRDIKPGNIFMNANGYLSLGDFGEATPANEDGRWSQVGTGAYMAPELTVDCDITDPVKRMAVDWWSVGITLYEMVTGKLPFYNMDEEILYDKIVEGRYSWPKKLNLNPDVKDLVSKMLVKDASKRYTANNIRSHPWMSTVKWEKIAQRRETAPFVPIPHPDLSQQWHKRGLGRQSNFPDIRRLTPPILYAWDNRKQPRKKDQLGR